MPLCGITRDGTVWLAWEPTGVPWHTRSLGELHYVTFTSTQPRGCSSVCRVNMPILWR